MDCAPPLRSLDEAAQRLQALPKDASDDLRRALYLQARWAVRGLVFANPLLDFDRLLFVKRFTQETYPDVCLNHMPWVSRPGGDLCVLSRPLGRGGASVRLLRLASTAGRAPDRRRRLRLRPPLHPQPRARARPRARHGPVVGRQPRRVRLCAHAERRAARRAGSTARASYHFRRTVEPTHIFEIGVDGRNLRQLTSGEWSDLDPTYTPGGDIVFVSERCGTSLQCNEYDKDETSCNLYVMKPDGSGIRRLSVNKDGDYLPHTLDDGTIAYLRWEYHERSWAFIQSIWTIRPDGTGADAIFKQHFVNPWALEDARSIPGSKKLVCIAAGHHTLAVGPVVVVDPSLGINEPKGMAIVTPDVKPPEGGMDGVPVPEGGTQDGGGLYSTPWALSEKCFLVSYTYSNKETDAKGYGSTWWMYSATRNSSIATRPSPASCRCRCGRGPARRCSLNSWTWRRTNATCVISDVSFGSEEIAGPHPLCPHRRADWLALRQPARRPALWRERPASDQLDAHPHPRRRAGRARWQRALRGAGRHRRLFPIARREPHGAAAHEELHQLPARRNTAPAPAATKRAASRRVRARRRWPPRSRRARSSRRPGATAR